MLSSGYRYTTEAADKIIADENFDEGFLLSDEKISLEAVKEEISKPVILVPQK